jgi:hypothetical protein
MTFCKNETADWLGRARRKLEDNIKIDLQEIGWEGMDWLRLTYFSNKW